MKCEKVKNISPNLSSSHYVLNKIIGVNSAALHLLHSMVSSPKIVIIYSPSCHFKTNFVHLQNTNEGIFNDIPLQMSSCQLYRSSFN